MKKRAYYHLPGLFEFYELYRVFLPLFREHREYFYDWCEIGSIYGAPSDCIWGGGRTSFGDADAEKVLDLMQEYKISARLTFSNSLLREEHLQDRKCNELCALLEKNNKPTKWCDSFIRSLLFRLSAKELSGSLSGLINYKSTDKFSVIFYRK